MTSPSRTRRDPPWIVYTLRLAGVAIALVQLIALPLLDRPVSVPGIALAAGMMGIAEAAKHDVRRRERAGGS